MKRCGWSCVLAGAVLLTTAVAWGQVATDDPQAIPLPAAKLDEYVGQYHIAAEPDIIASITREGDALYTEGLRSPKTLLRAESPDHFFISGSETRLVFERDSSGKVTGVSRQATGPRSASGMVEWVRFSDEGAHLNHFVEYMRTEEMVPVRDGVKLHLVILRPKGSEKSGEPLPFLMVRTPYGIDGESSDSVNASKPELAQSGYIFVFGDIRGRYGSEGQFVMNRPVVAHKTKSDIDETTDTYDTVAWLLKNVPNNNGKVGVYGISYPGFLATMAGIDAHPAVKAISPQAPMTNIWMGDDFFHNGAFRETYGFDYVQQLEAQKTDVRVDSTEDTFNFFLRNVNFAGAAKSAGMSDLPTAKAFLTHPEYSKFWQDMAVEPHLTKVEVPTLEVGGWWDQEDMWGPQAQYAALEPHDKSHEVFLVLGPWNHGGWVATTRHLGAVNFDAATGDQYRKTIEAPFFEKYLKDKPGFDLKDTASFRTGVNKWEHYSAWPPKEGFAPAKLYLAAAHGLSFKAPSAESKAEYVADPANPVPYRHRPIQSTYGNGSKWRPWLVEDQRFVSDRKDLANFTTAPLDHDVTVTGDVMADLFAATTGSDADWVVKLIDVYPDDAPDGMGSYQLMIADEILRGRYRKSFEKPEAVKPGEVTEYKWSLHGADHTFLKGHRIMVEVQSTWFPLYDRNPQTYVPNIMSAPATAYKPETISIYGSSKYPSHLEFEMPQ
ncbi:MAG: CocE/NonD family hydrolase [Edaphobacter sp.]|uniref:CocE/NonD family hydrolase n=1 Tax=Edaphobacter sp. TaxID=1934404 RepID=UPI0023919BE1|nr:CocE/NonD family hydrolase [Edaphobacter sp.]MDE1177650.1 CocE/NonD family hydrolase [Edaphobacter sp.]